MTFLAVAPQARIAHMVAGAVAHTAAAGRGPRIRPWQVSAMTGGG